MLKYLTYLKKNKEAVKVIAAYIAVSITWGTTYLAIRVGIKEFPPELYSGIRFLISGIIIALFVLFTGRGFPETFKDFNKIVLIGLLNIAIGHGLVIWVLQSAHSGVTALLLATSPIFIAIIESFFLRRNTINRFGWFGLITSFLGIALLVFSGESVGSINLINALLLLIAAALFAAGSVYSKFADATGSLASQIAIQMLVGGVGLTFTGLILGEKIPQHISNTVIFTIIYLIIAASLIGYACFMYILTKMPASKAGTYSYINTVIAIILGAALLGEPITTGVGAAILVILSGVMLVQFSRPAGKTS